MTTDERYSQKIIAAALEKPSGGNGGFDLGKYPDGSSPCHGSCRLKMTMDDSSLQYMEYYADEITILPEEVVGKTLREAWDLFNQKDLAYLRS